MTANERHSASRPSDVCSCRVGAELHEESYMVRATPSVSIDVPLLHRHGTVKARTGAIA